MKKLLHKGYTIAITVVLFLLVFSVVYFNWHQVKPILGVYKEALYSHFDSNYLNAKAELANIVRSNTDGSFLEVVDYTRKLVYENSIHKIDVEHDSYAFNKQIVTKKLWQSYNGKEKPHLSCGPRSYAMKDLLSELKIKSRIVDVFQDEELNSHTFLEVYNSNTDKWHIQDPDFNVIYVNKNARRLSALDLLTKADEKVSYLGVELEKMTSNLKDLHTLFEAVLIRGTYDGTRNVLFYIPEKFDLKKGKLLDNKKVYDVINEKYYKPLIFPLSN